MGCTSCALNAMGDRKTKRRLSLKRLMRTADRALRRAKRMLRYATEDLHDAAAAVQRTAATCVAVRISLRLATHDWAASVDHVQRPDASLFALGRGWGAIGSGALALMAARDSAAALSAAVTHVRDAYSALEDATTSDRAHSRVTPTATKRARSA